jgi:hypothetical protein
MALLPLFYPPPIKEIVEKWLQDKPGLREAYKRLEDSVTENPNQASPETFIIGKKKIKCRRKSIRATSYSKNMIFSKDEIVILYEILDDKIRVICVFFPELTK